MHRQQILIQNAQPRQVGDGGFAIGFHGVFDLAFRLGHVHVDADAVLIRQLLRAGNQAVRVVKYRAEPEPNADASVCGIVKTVEVLLLLFQLLFCGSLPYGGQPIAAVHDAFRQLGPQARFRDAFCHALYKLPAGFCETGHAGANQFQAGCQRGHVGILRRHIALKRPHAFMEPGFEIHVVPNPSGYLLRGVYMGVHKTRQHIFPGQVDYLGVRTHKGRVHNSYGGNPVILHQDPPAVIDISLRPHGDDIAVFQIGLSHCPALLFLFIK